jgi:hypothetical protein
MGMWGWCGMAGCTKSQIQKLVVHVLMFYRYLPLGPVSARYTRRHHTQTQILFMAAEGKRCDATELSNHVWAFTEFSETQSGPQSYILLNALF